MPLLDYESIAHRFILSVLLFLPDRELAKAYLDCSASTLLASFNLSALDDKIPSVAF